MAERVNNNAGLPSVTEQILTGVAKKNDLTQSQIDLLTDYARTSEQWQAWTIGVGRHPSARDNLTGLEKKLNALEKKIGADTKLHTAKNDLDRTLSEAGYENEP